MTDQPTSGSKPGDDKVPGEAPIGHRPPSDLPPQGSELPTAQTPLAAPHFQQLDYGQHGQPYDQPYDQPAAGYGQPASPYGTAYRAPGQPGYDAAGQQYGQQYGQQHGQPGSPYNAYGQPAYYGLPPEPKGLSIASLCCGVATLLGFGFFLLPQIAAVVLGHMALTREPAGRGMAIAGLVMGYLGIALTVLAIVFLSLLLAGSASYSGYRA